MRLIYVFTDVPHQRGTFAVAEVEAMAAAGFEVEMLCLRSRLTDLEAAAELKRRFTVHASPYASFRVLAATLAALARRPGWFVRGLAQAIADTATSPRILVKTLAILPKCCYLAQGVERDAARGETLLVAFWASLPARAAWWISGLTGVPYATWAHAGADIYNRNHQTEAALRTVVAGASFVLTCNRANLDHFARVLPPASRARVLYHPHGVDLDRFSRRKSEAQGGGPARLLSVGRLSTAKGFHVAVEACAELARRGLDFHYRIIGEGPLRDALETAIRAHGLEDRIALLGYREQTALPAEYASADLYLAPSVVGPKGARDGLPNVVLEAMAMGIAVVGSNAVGIPEAVWDGETGVLVEPEDPRSLADGVERLLRDPELARRVGEAGSKLVRERYGRRECMERLARIYASGGRDVAPWANDRESAGSSTEASR